MKIWHRISLSANAMSEEVFASLGISDSPDAPEIIIIDEDHPNWLVLKDLLRGVHHVDLITTVFTQEELTSSKWLRLESEWLHGYPQPNAGDFGYLTVTYDTIDYCKRCGIGLRQVAPFRMKSEPKWGRRSVMQLNWVFDEFFVKTVIFPPFD